ncbi:MAG: tyrosine-type recombinase/integrase [Lachnospiraceae bacterium]|nr:tyrosine-type recombinase/integrase [Lachnospiraceae bacterium]
MIQLNIDNMLPIIMYYTESGIIPLSDVRALDQEALMEKILKDIHHCKISKTKDGRWSTYIPDQTKPYGRRHVKKRSQAELNKFLLGFYKICDGASLMSFGELYAEWMAYKKQFVGAPNRKRSLSPSTIRRYERDYDNYIRGTELDKMLICEVTGPKLEMMLVDIIKQHDLAEKCAGNMVGYVRQAFAFARRCQYTMSDPADLIDRQLILSTCRFVPPKPDTERVLTVKELKQLYDAVILQQKKHNKYMPNYAIELAMLTGMRVGEIAALHWTDIDEECIHIDYSEHRLDYSDKPSEIVIGEPKNGKHRAILLTAEIRALLGKVKEYINTYPEGFVFVREDGTRHTGHDINCAVDRRASEAGIRKTSIHGIRRTVSSLLNTVLPQKAVAEMLGHTERVNEQYYNYSMAENIEKKRALEQVYSKVFNFSDYISEEKKTGSA